VRARHRSWSVRTEAHAIEREQHASGGTPDAALAKGNLAELHFLTRDRAVPLQAVIGRIEQMPSGTSKVSSTSSLASSSSKPGCTNATTGVMRKPVITTWSGR
jgi:hypothetical protein